MTAKEKRKLDRQFSKNILSRDNRTCQWCGKASGKMDTAHIIPRSVIVTRWLEGNAICLCFRCHQIEWHNNPLKAVRWLENNFGVEYCNNLLLSGSICL